jgi:hypothetical protein
MKEVIIFIIALSIFGYTLVYLGIPLVIALPNDAGNSINFDYAQTFNNNTANVNNSQYLQSYTWQTGWTNILKGLADLLYAPISIVGTFFTKEEVNSMIAGNVSTKGTSIHLYNSSVTGTTFHSANLTWNVDNAVINNIDVITESTSWNLTTCQNTAMNSNCRVMYVNRFKNASSYGSSSYTDEAGLKQIHFKLISNDATNTFTIKFTGVSA